MKINPILRTKELNKLDLTNHPGIRFYYSKTKNWISIAFLTVFAGFFIGLIFFTDELFLKILCLVSSLFLILFQFTHFNNILLKHPIFILDNTKLYYIHTNQWYDLDMHSFNNEIVGKNNYYLTFTVKDENGKQVLSENNWVLHDEDRFYKAVRYLKSNYPYEGELKQ